MSPGPVTSLALGTNCGSASHGLCATALVCNGQLAERPSMLVPSRSRHFEKRDPTFAGQAAARIGFSASASKCSGGSVNVN